MHLIEIQSLLIVSNVTIFYEYFIKNGGNNKKYMLKNQYNTTNVATFLKIV